MSLGRVKYLIENHLLKTESVRLFILDEADKLLEDNFQEQIKWVYGNNIPFNCVVELYILALILEVTHIFSFRTDVSEKIIWFSLTLYTLKSVCIFSILLFIHFLRCWQGEFVCQSKTFFHWQSFPLFSWP